MQPYWLSRPGPQPDVAARAEFDALLSAALAAGPGTAIDYRLTAPKWQFLCHVADHGEAVLHGSSDPDIDRFEPRQSNDIAEFGNRRAVYAAADGLWALFFAILDRPRHRMSLTNSCFRVLGEDGSVSEPYYYFAVNNEVLEQDQLGPGTVYLPGGRVRAGARIRRGRPAGAHRTGGQPGAGRAAGEARGRAGRLPAPDPGLRPGHPAHPGGGRPGRVPMAGRRRGLTGDRAGIGPGSVPDRAWSDGALLHTVRS